MAEGRSRSYSVDDFASLSWRFEQQVEDVVRERRIFGHPQMIRKEERHTAPFYRALEPRSPIGSIGQPFIHQRAVSRDDTVASHSRCGRQCPTAINRVLKQRRVGIAGNQMD